MASVPVGFSACSRSRQFSLLAARKLGRMGDGECEKAKNAAEYPTETLAMQAT